MRYEMILYEADDRVAVISLNRPQRMNALSDELCAEVTQAVQEADRDPDVRVLVLTGAGRKAFSAGYDIKDSAMLPKRDLAEWRERMHGGLQFSYAIWNCTKPIIAMINGYCLAGGLELAQMCDMRYASEEAKFGVTETRFANGVGTLIMPWILGARCRELVYTGDMIGADEAFRLGLVNRIFPKAALERETMKIAKRMSRVALAALQWNKRAINQTFAAMGLHAALQYGVEASAILDALETPEYDMFDRLRRTEGLAAALRWRDAQFAPYE